MHALAVSGFQVSTVLLYILDVLSPIHYITYSIFFFQFVSIPDGDTFRLDKLLIPFNIESLHCFLAVVFMLEKKVVIYDSLPVEDGRLDYLTDIFQYLKDEHKHKHGLDLPNVENWTTVPCPFHVQKAMPLLLCKALLMIVVFVCVYSWISYC